MSRTSHTPSFSGPVWCTELPRTYRTCVSMMEASGQRSHSRSRSPPRHLTSQETDDVSITDDEPMGHSSNCAHDLGSSSSDTDTDTDSNSDDSSTSRKHVTDVLEEDAYVAENNMFHTQTIQRKVGQRISFPITSIHTNQCTCKIVSCKSCIFAPVGDVHGLTKGPWVN